MDTTATPIGTVLEAKAGDGSYALGRDLWGFGGLHGGLAVALATAAMRLRVGDVRLRSVSAQFLRPLTGELSVSSDVLRAGRTATTARADLASGASLAVTTTATFGASRSSPVVQSSPPRPDAPPPERCPVVEIPVEFVPFSQHTEIRPVGPNRPFGGGDEAELTAWIRFVDDDVAPDELRLVTLLDSLAPSAAAVVSDPVMMPTVELRVSPGPGLASATSPWVLLHTRTEHASADGWYVEHIDAWAPRGAHLGSATQLRLVAAG